MKLSTSTLFVLAATMAPLVSSLVEPPEGFRQFGQTLVGTDPLMMMRKAEGGNLEFGSVVELSDDGSVMAVGAPSTTITAEGGDGAVYLYARDDSTVVEAMTESTWRLVWELSGNVEEGLGERLSLSDDGKTVAVRRGNGKVEVYRSDPVTGDYALLGAPVSACGDNSKHSKTVALAKSAIGSLQQSNDWLVVSCEDFDSFRGKVVVLRLAANQQRWENFSTIKGRNKNDRFGWDTAVNIYGQILTIAVSSPNHDGRRGMVQVYSMGASGLAVQVGSDMVGQASGDQFGFSVGMSTVGERYIVVGAPQCSGGGSMRGCVSLYMWDRTEGWTLFGQPIHGSDDGDRFGRAVAISKDGGRLAASSFHHGRQAGLVNLYDRDGSSGSSQQIKRKATFVEDAALSRWGYDIALSEHGSVLVSASSRGMNDNRASVGIVQAFLDATPFCGIPSIGSNDDLFLARTECRNSLDNIVFTSPTCARLDTTTSTGAERRCEWVAQLATQTPSASPSSAPSSSPTRAPSSSPTASPTAAPTAAPSAAPTVSQAPTTSPNSIRSESPTQGHNNTAPNASPTASPIAFRNVQPRGSISGVVSDVTPWYNNPFFYGALAAFCFLVVFTAVTVCVFKNKEKEEKPKESSEDATANDIEAQQDSLH